MKQIISKSLNNYFLEKYPALKERSSFRKMFMHLAFSGFENDDHQLLIPYEILCRMNNRDKGDGLNGGKFLADFRALVLPNFRWRRPNPGEDRWYCRTVRDRGFDPEDQAQILNELSKLSRAEGGIQFIKQRAGYRPLMQEDREMQLKDYLSDKERCFNLNPVQEHIMNHILPSALNGNAISRKLWGNLPAIQDAIQVLQRKPDDKEDIDNKKLRQYRILHSIKEDARIFYYPTRFGGTPRLHHGGECALGLAKPIREALCAGWTEIDCKQSQFKIVAEVLQCPLALDIARNGEDLWEHLHGSQDYTPHDKAIYKQLVYSFCFGKSVPNIAAFLRSHKKEAVLQNKLLVELLDARTNMIERINKDGSILDAWGNKHELEKAKTKKDIFGDTGYAKKRWAGSVFATLIQSIEMDITAGFCIDEYNNEHTIQLWIHDGVYVSIRSSKMRERILNSIERSIQERAKKWNINAEVGVKDL